MDIGGGGGRLDEAKIMTKTKHGALRNEKESVVGHIYQVSYG
jgi:hypothetical protein